LNMVMHTGWCNLGELQWWLWFDGLKLEQPWWTLGGDFAVSLSRGSIGSTAERFAGFGGDGAAVDWIPRQGCRGEIELDWAAAMVAGMMNWLGCELIVCFQCREKLL
jgi:hypothetical protein